MEQHFMQITINKKTTGLRLDKFLVKKLHKTRGCVQKLITNNLVFVNKIKKTPHYLTKEGDVVAVKQKRKNTKQQKHNNIPISEIKINKKIKIIEETDDYLIINKPANLIVHGGDNIKEKTMSEFLVEKYPVIKNVGEDKMRPGIVHRLDKQVSGLIVIAKNNKFFKHLKSQFQKRIVEKKYTALVYEKINKDYGEITFPIIRSSAGHKMAAIPNIGLNKKIDKKNIKQRNAITLFKVKKSFFNYTLLEITIKTGRTHQIRVHMLAYGHPVVGDNTYSTKKTREKNKKLNLGRIFLVSTSISFFDLKNNKQSFKINIPNNLKTFLSKIK